MKQQKRFTARFSVFVLEFYFNRANKK